MQQKTDSRGYAKKPTDISEGRILIVDDDYSLRQLLHATFHFAGFDVAEAAAGDEALALARVARYDIVLLSLRIPGESGIEICRELRRQFPRLGILVLTAGETEEEKVEALDSGADDYITKPFHMRELQARVRAAMRRGKTLLGMIDAPIRGGEIELQPTSRLVFKSNKQVHLTPKEFDVLHYIMAHSGVAITHARLLSAVWGADYVERVEYLRTLVRQLRKKLEDDATAPKYILTQSYIGYRFVGDENKT